MNLPAASGSPIIARIQNNSKLPVILGIAAVIVVVLVLIGEIIRRIRMAYGQSAESARQKTRPTNKADIAFVTKEYSLTNEESKLLYEICKKDKVPNARFFLRDYEQMTGLFKNVYQASAEQGDAEREHSLLFSIYEKICRSIMAMSVITSTLALREGQKLQYIDSAGKKYAATVVDSTENELIITAPKDKGGSDVMLQNLTKINLMIEGKNHTSLLCAVRVIRTQIKQDEPVVVVTHSNRFTAFLRHEYVYISAKIPCRLQSVTAATDSGSKQDAVRYEAEGQTYNGVVLNYSGKSCNVVVKNSVNSRQLLRLETKLNGRDVDQVIVMVLNVTENRESGAFLLHTNFVKLTEKTKNYILSHVYSFVEGKEGI